MMRRDAQLLLKQYKRMHKEGHFQGIGCLNYRKKIRDLVKNTHAESLLDYGCGKGRQFQMTPAALHAKLGVYVESWEEALGVTRIVGYDPVAWGYTDRPEGLFDGVYCCSVLEHVLEEDVPTILDDIFSHAQKFVFLAVGTQEAKKDLPSGGNAHVTVRPLDWWIPRIETVARAYPGIQWMVEEEREKEDAEHRQPGQNQQTT